MEFKYLSYLTNDPIYWNSVQKINKFFLIDQPFEGLVTENVDVTRATYLDAHWGLGPGMDSFYEYMYKQYLLTCKTETIFKKKWDQSVNAIRKQLLGLSSPHHFIFLGERQHGESGYFSPKTEHLSCFYPGILALSATQGKKLSKESNLTLKELKDLDLAEELMRSCFEMYRQVKSHLSPDSVEWNPYPIPSGEAKNLSSEAFTDHPEFALLYHQNPEWVLEKGNTIHRLSPISIHEPLESLDFQISSDENLQRPETIESLFILHRITGKEIYREMGWKIFLAFENLSKVDSLGYATLGQMNSSKPVQKDKMMSFFLSETLKYFYLLFSDEDLVPLDEYVFNTEAHPLPLFKVPPFLKEKLNWLDE